MKNFVTFFPTFETNGNFRKETLRDEQIAIKHVKLVSECVRD